MIHINADDIYPVHIGIDRRIVGITMGRQLRAHTLMAVFLFATVFNVAAQSLSIDDGPLIAGPVNFRVELIGESTVSLSWSDTLLDDSAVASYRIYNHNHLFTTVIDNQWTYSGIDRDTMYYFSVSAVTQEGEETRRSVPVHIDLPPHSGTIDGGNRSAPPLQNVRAEVVEWSTAVIEWDPAAAFWGPASNEPYRYWIFKDQGLIAEVVETRWTYHDDDPDSPDWIGIYAVHPDNHSGQGVHLLINTSAAAGSTVHGYPGFGGVRQLSADVYSTTAAEIFWKSERSRVNNVYLDGRLVERTSARSLYLDNLIPGTRYRVSVGSGWPYESDDGRDGLLRHMWIDTPSDINFDPNESENPDANDAGPPGAPRNIRGVVYSAGVVEIFWNPAIDDGRVVTYRVLRDGKEMVSRDAHSHFESGLEAPHIYRYSVYAIDDEGNVGMPARIELKASRLGPIPPSVTLADAPAAPGNLEIVVSSPGVAELFWQRSADHASLAGYEVLRDGERVAFHMGASHFEPRLSTAQGYDFEVIAVDNDGNRSASVQLRLEAPSSMSIITRDSYTRLLAHVFELFVGDVYNSALIGLKRQNFSTALLSRDSTGNPVLDVYACETGGATLSFLWSSTNYGNVDDWSFDVCLHDNISYDGEIRVHDGSHQTEIWSDAFVMKSGPNLTTTFSGYGAFNYTHSRIDNKHAWNTDNLSLNSQTVDENLVIENMSSSFGYETWRNPAAWLRGEFSVRSSISDEMLLHVSTPIEFTYPSSLHNTAPLSEPRNAWNFTRGQLEMQAEDGSRMLFDADTDNPATVRIMIVNDLGVDSFESSWTPWQALLRFERYASERP